MASIECCPEWRQLVSCQVDGELDEFDTARLNRHLAGCVPCTVWAAEIASLTGTIRSAEPKDPGRALTPSVMRLRRTRASLAAASAASVAAAAVAAFALQLPGVVGHARTGEGTRTAAANCRWCVAHRRFNRSAFVELPAAATASQRRVLLNPVASA